MRLSASAIRIFMILGVFALSNPAFSGTNGQTGNGTDSTTGNGTDSTTDNGTTGQNGFGTQIAGTYLVIRQPADGPTRVLNLFADGNLTSIQSVQFGGDVQGEGFSNQHGTWKSTGDNKLEATVLNLSYNPSTGAFIGTALATYNLQFDSALQTVTGTVKGQIFGPGVDPLNPGDAQPISEFSDDFQAKRVTVGTTDDSSSSTTDDSSSSTTDDSTSGTTDDNSSNSGNDSPSDVTDDNSSNSGNDSPSDATDDNSTL